MANFKNVNRMLQKYFCARGEHLNIEVVSGEGYMYYVGPVEIDSIMVHPLSISTQQLFEFAKQDIKAAMMKELV